MLSSSYHRDCPSSCLGAVCDGGYRSDNEDSGDSGGSDNCQREYVAITLGQPLMSHSSYRPATPRSRQLHSGDCSQDLYAYSCWQTVGTFGGLPQDRPYDPRENRQVL